LFFYGFFLFRHKNTRIEVKSKKSLIFVRFHRFIRINSEAIDNVFKK
jgi:hypothetical protein